MLWVEDCCLELLSEILPKVDPKREGLTIDIGVGTYGFYFELFDRLGFKTIAVEPLPCNKLRQLCKNRNIRLIESCISDVEGPVNIYLGTMQGKESLDYSSMLQSWPGSSQIIKRVRSMTLHILLADIGARKITCIKIDIEGMEYSIIKQFANMKTALLPRVVMFEYGGLCPKKSGKGGWSKEILSGTLKSLEILRNLGYGQTILIEFTEAEKRVFDLKSIELDPDIIFTPQSECGNIITMLDFEYPESRIASICRRYGNRKLSPIESFPYRVLRKIRHIRRMKRERNIRYYSTRCKRW